MADQWTPSSVTRAVSTVAAASTLLALLGAPLRAQSGACTFSPPLWAAGGTPFDVASGDFDGDGRSDVVIANGSALNIARQTARLEFAAPASIGASTAWRLYAADLDLDGDLDIVTARFTVQVWRNNGNASFTALPALLTVADGYFYGLAIADLDLDGTPDLAVADLAGSVRTFKGLGGGSFAAPTIVPLGAHQAIDITVADFNADGLPDLATVALPTDDAAVVLATAPGVFGGAQYFAAGQNSANIASGDVTGDGKIDLACFDSGAGIRVLAGNGSGGFAAPTLLLPFADATPWDIEIADFDRDGLKDVAGLVQSGRIRLFRSLGGGAFQALAGYQGQSSAMSGFAWSDLDNDGFLDAVLPQDYPDAFAILTGSASLQFDHAHNLDLGAPFYSSTLRLANIDTDGLPDVVFATMDGRIGAARGLPGGGFGPATFVTTGPIDDLQIGRIDGDALDDVIALHAHKLLGLRSDGSGGFFPTVTSNVNLMNNIAVGDITGDGFADVLGVDYVPPPLFPMVTSIVFGNGAGGFVSNAHTHQGIPLGSDAFHDFDGDGDEDLLVCANGLLRVYTNDGTGVLSLASSTTLNQFTTAATLLADLNADGRVDYVVGTTSNQLATLLGTPAGTFSLVGYTPVGAVIGGPLGLTAADFDGDGLVDVVACVGDGTLRLLRGDGAGGLNQVLEVSDGGVSSYAIFATDMDGDGDPDVLGGSLPSWVENLGPGCPSFTYCTAKTNSLGCVPSISATGTPSATATSGYVVRSSNVRNNKTGLLFYGVTGRSALPFSGGTQCVRSPIKRSPALFSAGSPPPASNCSGQYSIDMNAFAHGALGGNPLAALLAVGTVVDCQFWGRDPGFAPPNSTSLSDALEYVVEP